MLLSGLAGAFVARELSGIAAFPGLVDCALADVMTVRRVAEGEYALECLPITLPSRSLPTSLPDSAAAPSNFGIGRADSCKITLARA